MYAGAVGDKWKNLGLPPLIQRPLSFGLKSHIPAQVAIAGSPLAQGIQKKYKKSCTFFPIIQCTRQKSYRMT